MTDTHFNWDTERFEQLSNRCTQIMLGLMGLALMLMMMDLASPLILAPAAVVILITRSIQSFSEHLSTEFEDAEISLSPKTLLIKQPSIDDEKRLRYQDITEVEAFTKWRIQGIRLKRGEQDAIELIGFPEKLLTALQERCQQ